MGKFLNNSLWDYLTFSMFPKPLDIQINVHFFGFNTPIDVILPVCTHWMTVMAEVTLAQTANHVGVHVAFDAVCTEVALLG